MINITGAPHREFGRIERFYRVMKTTTNEIMSIRDVTHLLDETLRTL